MWKGILSALGIPFQIVHPRTWTKEVFRDMPGEHSKQKSFIKCRQIFPTLELKKPRGKVDSLDGRADAAMLAYWGLLQNRVE